MMDSAYRKRLAADLPAWRERGWVSADGAAAILDSVRAGDRGAFGLAAVVGTLGALLLGLGVIAFVSANWDAIPRLLRFGLLILAMGIAYGCAATLLSRGLRVFADAALLVAGLTFAASIALVGQTYHLSGDFAGAVLLFIVGMLGAALLTCSTVLTVLSIVAAGYWTWLVVVDAGFPPHWGSLVAIVIGGAIATWLGSGFARVVAIVALAFWVTVNLIAVASERRWPFAGTFAVLATTAVLFWAAGASLAALAGFDRVNAFGRALLSLGLVGLLLALGVLQTAPLVGDWGETQEWLLPAVVLAALALALTVGAWFRGRLTPAEVAAVALLGSVAIGLALWQPGDELIARLAGGLVVIAAAVWAAHLGQTGQVPGAKALGLAAFGMEIVYLYGVTIGTIMDTALAFLGGGILFVAMAWGLYRFERRLSTQTAEAAS